MDFYIKKFSMLSKELNKSFSEEFFEGINLIVGEKDSGKTSLARAIMFTLGCDVKNFRLKNEYPDMIFILEFSIDSEDYILVRKMLNYRGKGKNYFKLFNNDSEEIFDSTKSFARRINTLFNINIVTLNKDNERTLLYPNHLFLPFFIDQDFSWQNYLIATFSGLNFINNYRKIILEYYSGMRSNKYYELLLRKNEVKKEYQRLKSLNESKKTIYNENLKSMQIIEDIDIEKFKEKYEVILKVYNSVIKTEHEWKNKYNKYVYSKNSLEKQYQRLNLSINTVIPDELEEHCPNCNQIIYKTMDKNYKLLISKENLINEREKIQLELRDTERNLSHVINEIEAINSKSTELMTKLNNDDRVIDLADRAESYAFSKINLNLQKQIESMDILRSKKEEEIEEVEKQFNQLNSNNLSKSYNQLMIAAYRDLNINFSYKNYYTSNLEAVDINLSGASKVQAFLAQYLSIYELTLLNNECINIPMFIDTYLKDDLNKDEINRTTDFVFKKINKGHQSFLFISNNQDTLQRIRNYNYKYKELALENGEQLFTKDYASTYLNYGQFLN